jgi:HEAT repeat protein
MRLRPKKELILPLPRDLAEKYFKEYVCQTAPAIVSLTSSYQKKNDIVHAFYVFMLKKYGYLRGFHTSELVANLRDLLDRGDSICAEGVLLAVYQIGDPQVVLDVLRQVDKKDRFIHPKIISDGLLSFSGDAQLLQELILDQLSDFSEQMQVNLLNYLRFASGAHCERVLQLLQNEKTFDEVRFSCIRYFGKYPYPPAYDMIARFAEGESERRAEYAIVSLAVLRRYPSPRTNEILRAQITSPNWFIRYNATESLEFLGIEYQDLVDIFDGKDRFAREMLQYQFDQRYILDKEV